jgi:formate--tetrahydrofolate ligase
MRPLTDVAAEIDLDPAALLPWGRNVAKVDPSATRGATRGAGQLVLVSAINPTPAGEGKTTMSVALAMGLRRRGVRTALCLREPSLGPVFGAKGGAVGGGKARIEPSSSINLHFTGDIHAVGAAHNLLAAMVDAAIFHRTTALDPRRTTWPRVVDMNDRALRDVVIGLGEGSVRQSRFDITAASEVMAVLCLASDVEDLRARLGRIVVGTTADGAPVTAGELGAAEAMTALLLDASLPNLVQTAEGGPAFVHGGPFANIAHGCNSVAATRLALHHADVTITEAGFGFDLGGLKFLDLKCRQASLWPDAVVLVATLRALKMHGGAPVKRAAEPDADALARGMANLDHHIGVARDLGLPVVVVINAFAGDAPAELAWLAAACAERGVACAPCASFTEGGEGALAIADAVQSALRGPKPTPAQLYAADQPIEEKVLAMARRWGAGSVEWLPEARRTADWLARAGFANLPICLARVPGSLTDDPSAVGAPTGFPIHLRELRVSAGAGFIVGLTGEVMTMPGLPKSPSALRMRVLADGSVQGLMQGD